MSQQVPQPVVGSPYPPQQNVQQMYGAQGY
jgi:hypothetical protein